MSERRTRIIDLRDARIWQILALLSLLTLGMTRLGFDQTGAGIALAVGCSLATQAAFTWALRLPRFDPLSALITPLSLSILLRADAAWIMGLAGALAMASKFLIRVGGKHVFNPADFAIVVLLLVSGRAWISPAQWGSATWSAFLFASLAILVLSRAKRGDIALAFLGAFAGLVLLRALWLGDPLAIPLKQMQSGALLLFAFFMISDPKTVPDRRGHRIAYGALVATVGFVLQLGLYRPEGLMLALFFLSPLVPLIDHWRPVAKSERFQWSRPTV